jgi:hypothetical protein
VVLPALIARGADLFVLASDDEHRPLADIGEPVGIALQVVRRPVQIIGTVNGFRVSYKEQLSLPVRTPPPLVGRVNSENRQHGNRSTNQE